MATTVYDGTAITSSTQLLHTGAGRLLGFLLSNGTGTAGTVAFYDNTSGAGTILLAVQAAAGMQPTLILFPRDRAPAFSTGLFVDRGANPSLSVWAVGY